MMHKFPEIFLRKFLLNATHKYTQPTHHPSLVTNQPTSGTNPSKQAAGKTVREPGLGHRQLDKEKSRKIQNLRVKMDEQ